MFMNKIEKKIRCHKRQYIIDKFQTSSTNGAQKLVVHTTTYQSSGQGVDHAGVLFLVIMKLKLLCWCQNTLEEIKYY